MQIEGDTTRKNLIGIISRCGQNILEDPKKLKNLLLDLNQGIEKKEVNIICNSLDDMIPFDLIKNKDNLPYEIIAERSMQRLQNSYGITEDLARWTVDTWALALNIISRNAILNKKSSPEKKTPGIKTKLEPVQAENIPTKKTPDVYIRQVSMPLPISRPTLPQSKNQITGKYEQNKFVLLLAGICFAMPWILLKLFPSANVQSSGIFDQIIAWSSMLLIALFFVLLAAYGGYIFTLKK